MIIEFTLGNFLSFKDKKTLSLEATAVTEHKDSVFKIRKQKLLKSVVLYGANSSGKSNFIKGMAIMREIILASAEKSSVSTNDITPFLLNTATEKEPSFFEILFLINGIRYRYGFEIDKLKVYGEWLFELKGKKEKPMFLREGDGIAVTSIFEEGNGLESRTRDNALFLSIVDQFNGEISGKLMRWFNNWVTMTGVNHKIYEKATFLLLKDDKYKKQIVSFFRDLDLGFETLELKEEKLNNSSSNKSIVQIDTIHKKYDAQDDFVGFRSFDLREQESSGTNKIFDIAGYIFAFLAKGGVLVIDELNAKLHPLMTHAITNLFNSEEYNPYDAQLIFTTHDTNLLSYGKFRRDQIYFVEKDRYGASDLHSLAEFREEEGKKVRKDRSFEKDYIAGRYGGIPFVGNFDELLAEVTDGEEN